MIVYVIWQDDGKEGLTVHEPLALASMTLADLVKLVEPQPAQPVGVVAGKQLHWTQRPENRRKLLRMARKGAHSRHGAK